MMNDGRGRRYPSWLYIGLMLATALACNLPLRVNNAPPPPPSRPPLPSQPAGELVLTPAPAGTVADFSTPEASSTPLSVLPTFTPIADSPFLAPTATPRDAGVATPALPNLPSPTAETTPTPGIAPGGPLALSYAIAWRVEDSQAIATVHLTASGGDGVYTYFHDEQVTAGPVFEYRWATCNANPGSFRVNSGDGQTVRVNYYETPPCPNP